MANYMIFSLKFGVFIIKMSYNFTLHPKLYDFYKKNLLQISFAFIFIVGKLQRGGGFQGVLSSKN